jgi:hypothetical protein
MRLLALIMADILKSSYVFDLFCQYYDFEPEIIKLTNDEIYKKTPTSKRDKCLDYKFGVVDLAPCGVRMMTFRV